MMRSARQPVFVLFLLVAVACGRPAGDTDDPAALMTPEALQALAPTLDGWDRGTIHAQTIDVPEVATVMTVRFTHPDGGQLDLEISDTAGKSSMIGSLAAEAESQFNRVMGNGYLKGTVVAGAPAVEAWNTEHRLGELTVLVNKRYIIHVGGTGLADAAPMRAVVERINFAQLK